jgi:hypothetical protein
MPVGQWQTQIFRDICGRCGAAPGVEAVNDSPLPAALVRRGARRFKQA